jgi:uncharacterized protein YjbI with pentapeptide repeats
MFHSFFTIVSCFMAAAGGSDTREQFPKGVWSSSFVVQEVRQDTLTVTKVDDFNLRGAKLKLKVSGDSQFELVELRLADAKPTMVAKRISLQDLLPDQPISVIFLSDGKELTVLRAVASSGGMDLARIVRKLGGTAKRVDWPKDSVAYSVDLRGAKITDADLAALSLIHGMAHLDLSFTGITDKGIANLAGYSKLQSMNLTGAKVTDAAIGDLLRIKDLNNVVVAQTEITDEAVARLIGKKPYFTVCKTALGDKARFRVFQEYRQGQLQFNYLMINDTYYGRYNLGKLQGFGEADDRDRRREATTYYHRLGPVGQVMSKLEWFTPASVLDYPSDARMPASLVGLLAPSGTLPASALVDVWSEPPLAVVRLNAGTHAAYGRPFQHIHFYNSSPELTTFSLPEQGQPALFGFIRDGLERGCNIRVFDGPERTTIAKNGPKRFYRVLFVDLTRNDLRDINTALLTKEALADMMDCLTEKGIVCFHTSHRYHNLVPAIADAAGSLKLACKHVNDLGDRKQRTWSHFGSEWVMVARTAADLRHLTSVKTDERSIDWAVPASTGKHLWRDGEAPNLDALARPAGK